MNTPTEKSWLPAAIATGVTYTIIGITFALIATHAKAWRLAAWAVSAAVYVTHICYERFRKRNSHSRAALHVTLAVALGAFGVAVAANLHALNAESAAKHHLLLMLSLALWPLIISVPAFCVALAASWLLTLVPRRRKN